MIYFHFTFISSLYLPPRVALLPQDRERRFPADKHCKRVYKPLLQLLVGAAGLQDEASRLVRDVLEAMMADGSGDRNDARRRLATTRFKFAAVSTMPALASSLRVLWVTSCEAILAPQLRALCRAIEQRRLNTPELVKGLINLLERFRKAETRVLPVEMTTKRKRLQPPPPPVPKSGKGKGGDDGAAGAAESFDSAARPIQQDYWLSDHAMAGAVRHLEERDVLRLYEMLVKGLNSTLDATLGPTESLPRAAEAQLLDVVRMLPCHDDFWHWFALPFTRYTRAHDHTTSRDAGRLGARSCAFFLHHAANH